ncbi:MAG: site-specific DNA-methyltransferase [Pseudomonadota bacterium]|nr:site-specific DNA-methyltransferase [Pseudomonadota bacterium]
MTELTFKGKEFVYNHHLAVPFRPLDMHPDKGIGPARLDGNLIVQGDNLHALKSLLPTYAGKVDCIFIDPPYNTGNEDWAYSDNVNSPMIREWLNDNPIGIEDGLRHDKWCAMMWPRLRLLHELLADHGSIWITLDDNEAFRMRAMLDELFGEGNLVAEVSWQKRYTRSNNTNNFTSVIDRLIVFQKSDAFDLNLEERDEDADARYTNPDDDERGPWKAIPFLNPASADQRPNLAYPLTNPHTGETSTPNGSEKAWRNSEATYRKFLKENRFWWGKNKDSRVPSIKRFLSEVKSGMAPINFWEHSFAGHTDEANAELKEIFGEKAFDTPKPKRLLQRVLEHATGPDSVILDSFAGSATTAHAVLEANKRDGGSRRFILVEMEDYADRLTAERVRRVINGYDFKGTKKTELLRERLNWRALQNAETLVQKVESVEKLEGDRFDKITKHVKDGELIVTGEKTVKERAEGLGGEFTYCTLGAPVELDRILTGEQLPPFEALGAALYHMAANNAADPNGMSEADFYVGANEAWHIWLIYKPDLDWLKSPDAALTLARARQIAEAKPGDGRKHLVFAPARFVSQKMLAEHNLPVEFAPLPYALYRIERA